MRSNEQFKAFVYKKADEVSAKNKKNRAVLMRGIATFSLIVVVSGALIYSGLSGRKMDLKSENEVAPALLNEENGINDSETAICYSANRSGIELYAEDEMADVVELQSECSVTTFPPFSYKADKEEYSADDAGVVTALDCLESVSLEDITADKVLEIAKAKCTVEYDSTDIYFDSSTDTWKIVFSLSDTIGGCQSVYIDSNGNVKLIVYGE